MDFNESTRLSLERNFGRITGIQKECDDRYRKQFEHNHSIYERRDRVKVEAKKGQSKKICNHKAKGQGIGLSSPPTSP